MKKKNVIKFSAAMLALSAVTPVAAFANETPATTTPDGFYTSAGFVALEDFQKMSRAEKKVLLTDGLAAKAIVLVQGGQVFDLTNTAVQNAQTSEVQSLAVTVEEYTAETGNTLSTEKGIEGETPEENSNETFFYNLAA